MCQGAASSGAAGGMDWSSWSARGISAAAKLSLPVSEGIKRPLFWSIDVQFSAFDGVVPDAHSGSLTSVSLKSGKRFKKPLVPHRPGIQTTFSHLDNQGKLDVIKLAYFFLCVQVVGPKKPAVCKEKKFFFLKVHYDFKVPLCSKYNF